MYVQIMTFRLHGISHEEFAALCDQVAPGYADIDGCISKLFVRDPDDADSFGGVYVWETREAAEAYVQDGVAALLVESPQFADFEVSYLEILPGPTAVSGGPFAELVRRVVA
jgi:quinol monooxygenase YgiN